MMIFTQHSRKGKLQGCSTDHPGNCQELGLVLGSLAVQVVHKRVSHSGTNKMCVLIVAVATQLCALVKPYGSGASERVALTVAN